MMSFPQQSQNMSHSSNSCTEKRLFTANKSLTTFSVVTPNTACVSIKPLSSTRWEVSLNCDLSSPLLTCHIHVVFRRKTLRIHAHVCFLFKWCHNRGKRELASSVQLCLTKRWEAKVLLGKDPDWEQTRNWGLSHAAKCVGVRAAAAAVPVVGCTSWPVLMCACAHIYL